MTKRAAQLRENPGFFSGLSAAGPLCSEKHERRGRRSEENPTPIDDPPHKALASSSSDVSVVASSRTNNNSLFAFTSNKTCSCRALILIFVKNRASRYGFAVPTGGTLYAATPRSMRHRMSGRSTRDMSMSHACAMCACVVRVASRCVIKPYTVYGCRFGT